MDKIVGLSRAIKAEWLIKTASLVADGANELDIKNALNEYLKYEIGSPTNLRKSREILMNIWLRSDEPHILSTAVQAFRSEQSNKTALSWALLWLAYPIFDDISGLIGKISTVQDTFSTSWLKEKLFSIWGERQTLLHSTDKILQTLKSLDAIENVKVGVYKIKKQTISDDATVKTMLMVLMSRGKKSYYEITELTNVLQFFPFEYDVSLERLHNDPDFVLNNFGGKLVVSSRF